MSDTADTVAQLMAERHASMTPAERMLIAAGLFDAARAIVESSLPEGLTRQQRRYALVKRLHGDELPEAALMAYATYTERP